MTDVPFKNQVIRIPNLPNGQIVDSSGNATDDELTFRHALVTQLQSLFGNEGMVMPTQDPTSAATILNHQNDQGTYTCQLGTMLYVQHPSDYTQDIVVIAVRNDNTYPNTAPVFKSVTLV